MSDLPVRETVSAACHQIIRGARDLRVLSSPLNPDVLTPVGLQALATTLTALSDLTTTVRQDVDANVRMHRTGWEPQSDQSPDLMRLEAALANAVGIMARLQRRAQNAMNQRCGHCERHAELRASRDGDGTEYEPIRHTPTCPLFRVVTDTTTDPSRAALRVVEEEQK